MSQEEIDLWPSVFGPRQTELPDAILREQASRLGEKTGHLVEARVAAPEHARYLADRIRLAFYLVAPQLGNYSYRLFTIEYALSPKGQEITGYPVKLVNEEERICNDREEFVQALRETFASQATLQIISALMGDSVAA